MVKCKECGSDVSTKAKICPSCGAKVPKKVGILGWAFVLIVVLPFAWNLGTGMGKINDPAPKTAPQKEVPSPPKWSRYDGRDKMSDAEIVVLSMRSKNGTEFDFPYKVPGGSYLTISMRRVGSKVDAYLAVDKGQMLCHLSDCNFTLRIGDGQIQKWTGLPSSTNESDLMFVRDAKQFEKILAAGKPIRVGIDFFQAGTRVFEFEPDGYPGLK